MFLEQKFVLNFLQSALFNLDDARFDLEGVLFICIEFSCNVQLA